MIKGFSVSRNADKMDDSWPAYWYPDYAEPVQLLSYDGDKYFRIRFEDGTEDEVKGHWLRRDQKGDKFFRRRHKHILEGKDPRDFRAVEKKTEFRIWCTGLNYHRIYHTRIDAIRAALYVAKHTNMDVEISIERRVRNNSGYSAGPLGRFGLYVSPDGTVCTYTHRKSRREGFIKYVRGHGKINPQTHQQRAS